MNFLMRSGFFFSLLLLQLLLQGCFHTKYIRIKEIDTSNVVSFNRDSSLILLEKGRFVAFMKEKSDTTIFVEPIGTSDTLSLFDLNYLSHFDMEDFIELELTAGRVEVVESDGKWIRRKKYFAFSKHLSTEYTVRSQLIFGRRYRIVDF